MGSEVKLSVIKSKNALFNTTLAHGVSIAGVYAGVAVVDEYGRIALIKRADDPARGIWSLPAGYVENGETPEQAAIREAKEETCLDVSVDQAIGEYEGKGFRFLAYAGRVIGGSLVAGDDAIDARFFTFDEVPFLNQLEANDIPLNQSWAIKMNIEVLRDTIKYYKNRNSANQYKKRETSS